MAARTINLTRAELATFLKSQEQIRQFEKLFSTVDQVSQAPDTQGTSIGADSSQTIATQALGEITALKQDTAINYSVVEHKLESISALVKRPRIGQFYDTTTQTAAAINTAYAMTLNTTDESSGVYVGAVTSQVYVDSPGTYNVQFSAQMDNTCGGNHLAYIWLCVNGVDVAQSAFQIRLKGTDGELVAAWNWLYKFKQNDYFELMWSVSDTAVRITAQAAAAPVPAIPSVVVTCFNLGD
jgi:hypothetical protein